MRTRFFLPPLKFRFNYLPNLLVKNVLQANEVEALSILKRDPTVLLKIGWAQDYSGRHFTGTGFQAALSTRDVKLIHLLKKYFKQAEEIEEQFKTIFPITRGGYEGHLINNTRVAFDLTTIHKSLLVASEKEIQAALRMQEDGSFFCFQLKNFREAFTMHSHQEKVYNPQHLLNAFAMYDNHWECVSPLDSLNFAKRALFWCQILGFVQRFVPAREAKAWAFGLHDIFTNKRLTPQTFNFQYDPKHAFFPLIPCQGVGYEMAISAAGRFAPYCLRRGGNYQCYKAYSEDKNATYRQIESVFKPNSSNLSTKLNY